MLKKRTIKHSETSVDMQPDVELVAEAIDAEFGQSKCVDFGEAIFKIRVFCLPSFVNSFCCDLLFTTVVEAEDDKRR